MKRMPGNEYWKEPLLHFLLLRAAIFVAYSVVSQRSSDEPGKITISQGQVTAMTVGFTRVWQRPPTTEEMEGLIRDRVREEVYYREAIALGLDRDDTIIRRRLRQKMEFISNDVTPQSEPTDGELNAYLHAHLDVFRVQRQLTFSQVYFNPEKHGENLARDIVQLLAQLNQAGSKADVSALGDSLMLEHTLVAVSANEVAQQFGDNFAAQLGELALGQWQGPVESGYGVHLVLVTERIEGRVPALADVRDAVRREWINVRQLAVNEEFYAALLKRYAVTVERLSPAEKSVDKPVEKEQKIAAVRQ